MTKYTFKLSNYHAIEDANITLDGITILSGENGSGKSTLLRMLTGIMEPDRGEFILKGEPPTLLSLGAGFIPDLTGIDNIYMNGLLLGHSRKKIEENLELYNKGFDIVLTNLSSFDDVNNILKIY